MLFHLSTTNDTEQHHREEFNTTIMCEKGEKPNHTKKALSYKVILPLAMVHSYIIHLRSGINCKAALPLIGPLQSVFLLLGRG